MIDNQEVATELRRIADALEAYLAWLGRRDDAALAFQAQEIDRQADALQGSRMGPQPRIGSGWPTPATQEQGFLSARWQRRDGDVYASTAAVQSANSPIRGGDDAAARVDVPSGAPRSPEHT